MGIEFGGQEEQKYTQNVSSNEVPAKRELNSDNTRKGDGSVYVVKVKKSQRNL